MKINRKLRSTSLLVLQCAILQLFFQHSFAQQGGSRPPEVVYKVDWNERLSPNLGLKPHDLNLLGDYVEPHTGRLSFEHVDVSIPGNSALPVEIRRRRNPSQSYNNEFADWQLAVPSISTKIMSTEFSKGIRWGKKRCSDPLLSSIPNSDYPKRLDSTAPFAYAADYNEGVLLDVPGRSSGQLLDKTITDSWPAAAKKVTADGWYFTCLSNIDGASTEGFYGYSPNGERYKFDIIRSRKWVSFSEFWLIRYDTVGSQSLYEKEWFYYDVLAASEVLDVHGNWVRYVYDSQGRLTRIHSNDGRQIDLTYESASSPRITMAASHMGTTDERRWNYAYGSESVFRSLPPIAANGVPRTGYVTYQLLKSVTLPDGGRWQFNLGGLFAEAVPGNNYKTLPGGQDVTCTQLNQTVSVTHPDGVTGEFELKEHSRFISLRGLSQYGPPCPNSTVSRSVNTIADVMAVTRKTLSATGIITAEWEYEYANAANSGTGYNQTTVKRPDDSVQKLLYTPPSSYDALAKEEIFVNSSSSTPLETKDYSYLLETAVGSGFVRSNMDSVTRPLRRTDVVITRGSDVYRTRYTHIADRASASYSYGYPTKIQEWSSLGGGTRTTDITYLKDADDWILGLTNTIIKNGKLFDDYDYDTKGRVVTHKRFGSTIATLGYHSTGTQAGQLNWHRDALSRQTTYSDYYRGIPRLITRADSTTFARTVDRNGQVTRDKNWRGYSTYYQYNHSGYLTLIDRPSPWTDTQIQYEKYASGLSQFITKGMDQTVNTYDAMLRLSSTYREDLNGGDVTTINKKYDAMGREIFSTLPQTGYISPYGIKTQYDALGRVTQVIESAPGGGTTYYEYLAGNKTRITDPMNNITVTTASGFGDPGDGKPLKIEKPLGITTDFTYDIYGNVLTMAQAKGNGTALASRYVYDSRMRLCRLHMPERSDTLYAYNSADQLTGYAEGQSTGTVCSSLPSGSGVALGYDNLGRLTTTNYPGTTPDISRTYDANDNLLTLNRNGINWTYTYNTIDLPVTETLSIDGRSYQTTNAYSNDAVLTAKTYPSGRHYTIDNDGLGRPTRISSYLNNITYHPNGKINTLSRGNGGIYELHLNERQLTSYIGGNWGDKRYYYYDANRRITSINSVLHNVYDRGFGYDGAGRLSSATGPWGTASYQFDDLGNITKKTEGSRVVDIQYSTVNRIASVRDSATGNVWRNYSHDARGNVISDGRHNFAYDYSNQPISIGGATTGTYTYDGNLKRAKQVVDGETIYSIYDKSGVLLTRDNVTRNEKTDYISLEGQTFVRVKNGVATYPLNDHLGTAVMEADQNGSVPADRVYNYTPWGETIDAVPFGMSGNNPGSRNEQGFTGHIEDTTGLVYMQARYYDPVVGRFLSTDPIGYADQLNLYAYVHNDPVNKIDPTGKWAFIPWLLGWATAGGTTTATTITVSFTTTEIAVGAVAGTAIAATAIAVQNESTESNDEVVSDREAGSDGKRGSTGGPGAGKRFNPETSEVKEAKEGVSCRYCGTPTTNEQGKPNSRERDHIDPKSRGGNNSPDNEGDSCRTCNRSKGARNPDEWQPPKDMNRR